jgi:hypothetical protein
MHSVFHSEFGGEPTVKTSVYKWWKLFGEAARICKGKSAGKQPWTEYDVAEVESLLFALEENQQDRIFGN